MTKKKEAPTPTIQTIIISITDDPYMPDPVYKPTEVEAQVYNHLAVHESAVLEPKDPIPWTVTHIPTGFAIDRDLTEEQAHTLAIGMAKLFPDNGEFSKVPDWLDGIKLKANKLSMKLIGRYLGDRQLR